MGFCAIVSHPADTLVSYLNKAPGSGIGDAVKVLGFKGLWLGLVPRIIMIGTLTALQWFIYDGVKVALRLPRPPPPDMPESLKAKGVFCSLPLCLIFLNIKRRQNYPKKSS